MITTNMIPCCRIVFEHVSHISLISCVTFVISVTTLFYCSNDKNDTLLQDSLWARPTYQSWRERKGLSSQPIALKLFVDCLNKIITIMIIIMTIMTIIIIIIMMMVIIITVIMIDLQCPYLGLRSRQSRIQLSALPTLFSHPCQPPEDDDDDDDDDDDQDHDNGHDHDDDDDDDDWTWSLPLVQMYISFPTSPGRANH